MIATEERTLLIEELVDTGSLTDILANCRNCLRSFMGAARVAPGNEQRDEFRKAHEL